MARVPVVRIGNNLLATVLEELRDSEALELQEQINSTLEKTGASGVILDVSVLQTMDSFLGRLLRDIAVGSSLLGARTVVVGIQPAVAITLVELGLLLDGVKTALNLEKALALLADAPRAAGPRA